VSSSISRMTMSALAVDGNNLIATFTVTRQRTRRSSDGQRALPRDRPAHPTRPQ
jgi:hypothetical protein